LEECNINELIENFISGFFEREMKVDNVEIIRKYGAGLPVIKTDINQMKQVIVNLLNNAKDAIEGSGKIIIETAFINDKVLISVTDNGVGIPEDKINKIFLPFFTTKPVGKGTGLGLSVSFSIIKNLGGSISVESELGKGTTFTIELPVSSNISNIKSQKKSAKIQ
jgi:two-component system NtrC family sensor kinase